MTWEPAVGTRVEIEEVVRSLAGEPGYPTMPGTAPGTITRVHYGMTTLGTTQVPVRVEVAWDDPGSSIPTATWRVGDLRPAR